MPVTKQSRPGRWRGFTLIEVMLAIAILAILVGIAIPSFVAMMERSRVESSADELITAMRYARSEAIQRNETISINDGGDYATGWSVVDNADVSLRVFEGFENGVQCNGCPLDVKFNGRGEAFDGTGCFTITDGTRSVVRQLYRSGGFVEGCGN